MYLKVQPRPASIRDNVAMLHPPLTGSKPSNKSSNPSPSDTHVLVARYRSRTPLNYTSLREIWIAADCFLDQVCHPPVPWTGEPRNCERYTNPSTLPLGICADSRRCLTENIGWKWRLLTMAPNAVIHRDNAQTSTQPPCHHQAIELEGPCRRRSISVRRRYFGMLLLPDDLNTLPWTVLKEVADECWCWYRWEWCWVENKSDPHPRISSSRLKHKDVSSTTICLTVANTYGHDTFVDFQTLHLQAQHDRLSTRTTSSTRSGENRSRSRTRPPFAIGDRGRDGDGENGDASSGPGRDVGTPNNKLIMRKSCGRVSVSSNSVWEDRVVHLLQRQCLHLLVGRHKHSKSGAVLGDVPPSPSAAFFRNPNAGQEPVPPVPYSLPPLPGSASASTSQLSLKLPSSLSALNLPIPVNPKKSTAGRRVVSNSSRNSSVQPPSTASSVSRPSAHQGRASEDGKKRPSIGGGKRSLDFDLKLFQAGVKQATKQEPVEEIENNSKASSKGTRHPNALLPPPPIPLLPPIELHPPSPPNTITPASAHAPSKVDSQQTRKVSSLAAAALLVLADDTKSLQKC
ncbi:hypothetical protein CPC08DRAFT_730220 [Agrocybe pediades]|nr:hypothetical protein CPC08DRAFT_730220 [Agrocybe pediades]